MAKDILYSMAEMPTGQLIKARDADKGGSYACPVCKQPFVFRKGSQKRPHFAHKVLSPNCKPETALHYSFKTLLYDKIQKHLDQDLPLRIQWTCSSCQEIHTGNLLKKAVQVRLEHNLGTCRPDIALLDRNDCMVAAIEVVVAHAPEQTALKFYKQNRIALVLYSLKSDEDIERLSEDVLEPNDVNLCTNPKCPKCGEYMHKKRLLIIDAKCWKCYAAMKVAALRSDSGHIGLSDFSESDIQRANQNGCFLKSRYSRVVEDRYIANTCRRCGRFIGDHHLFGDYVSDLTYERKELDAEYFCDRCS